MAKQTFTTGQVLTAAQMTSLQQTAMGGGSATAKTASYVLVAADAGTTVIMNAAGSTTITVNTSLFAAGDTVFIQNIGAGTCTVTAGTATVSTAGSLALTQYEAGILYFTATGTALFNDYVQAASNPLTTTGDMIYSSSGSTQARLGIGSTSQVLTVSGGIPAWATPASGGMTLISETVASALSSLTFSSLGSYKQLLLVYDGLFYSANGVFALRFNNDSGSNYVNQALVISNNTASNNASTTAYVSPNWSIFGQSVTSATEHQRLRGYIVIDNYTSSTKRKAYYGSSSWKDNQYAETNSVNYVGSYNSTTAITSLDIVQVSGTPTLSNTTNTTIRLYGVA
jgi:hypothetical protein